MELPAGSSLVLYTDGLTEFEREPESGERKLREVLRDPTIFADGYRAKQIVERMMNQAAASDDVAVLVVNVCASPEANPENRESLQHWTLHTSDPRSVYAARAAFAAAFERHGGSPDDVAMAEIAFGELVSNAVRYAPGPVKVIADWSAPEPVLHVLDYGPGFRHISILPPDLLSESGRGLFIISALTHDFRVSKRANGGSHARAVLPAAEPPARQRRRSIAVRLVIVRPHGRDRHHLRLTVPEAECASTVRRMSSLARNCSASCGGAVAFSCRHNFRTVSCDSRMVITVWRRADLTAACFMRVQTRSIEFMPGLSSWKVFVMRRGSRFLIALPPVYNAGPFD